MIHLGNLSTSLAQVSEAVHSAGVLAVAHASPLAKLAEADPENPPVIGPGGPHHPNPPGEDRINSLLGAVQTGALADPLAAVALNPQPLPPRELFAGVADRFSAVAINPQPLPPKESFAGIADRLSAVALNPQPLPPKESVGG